MGKQVVILAAGAGNRARPFTENKPKCMFEVTNKPLLHCAIDALVANGIRDIIIVVGYKKERIYDYLSTVSFKGLNISFVEQKKLLGSSEAILECADKLNNDDFIVVPADKYYTAETIVPIINAPSPTMLTLNPLLPTYATAKDASGKIFIGRFNHAQDEDPIDTRIYSLNKSLFKYMDGYSCINEAFNALASKGIKVSNIQTNGVWADLLFPWDIITINELNLKVMQPNVEGTIAHSAVLRGNISIGDRAAVGSNCSLIGDICIGKSCEIKDNVVIHGPTSIESSTVIEPFTYISNSVIGKNVRIGAGSVIKDSIIDDNTIIKARFTADSSNTTIKIGDNYFYQQIGTMIGSGCTIQSNVSVVPGTIIGNKTQVNDNKTLSGNIPDGSMVV